MVFIKFLNVIGLLDKLNGKILNWNRFLWVVNVVFILLNLFIVICE